MKRLLLIMIIAILFTVGCTEGAAKPSEDSPHVFKNSWNTIVVDSNGNVGEYSSIAIDSKGKAHITYFNYLADELIGDVPVPFGNLKYASNASGYWEAVTIDTGSGMLPRICIDHDDKVHIIHSKLGTSDPHSILDLRYTANVTGVWETVTIGSQVVKGADSSIAVDSKGKVHISTRNEEGTGTSSEGSKGGLRYITNATREWTWTDVDTSPTCGNDTDITVDNNDKVHISYLDKSQGLKYATNVNGSWEVFNVDDEENVGWNTSIVTDSNNTVYISYSDPSPIVDPPGNGYLKYATNKSGTWTIQIIDDDDAGAFTGITVDYEDNLHISYCKTDGTRGRLMYITNTSGSWVKETADEDEPSVGVYCAIDVDPDGNPHISHYDYIDQNVRYSTRK